MRTRTDFYRGVLRNCNVSLLVLAIVFFINRASAQTFPSGFSQVKVATVYYPTSMAFAPDGRIFVTEKSGKVKVIKNGNVMSPSFCTVAVDELNERGLSCVALDPDFNTNHYVYIYYTSTQGTIHNRLSRFTANGDVALPGSEVILLEIEPSQGSIHNGGGICFGNDGKLYIGVGNDNVNAFSQDLTNYKGKVLRINKDGSAPSGNPYSGSEAAKRIWTYGLRNPWTVSLQKSTGKIFVNDVGGSGWEEINNTSTSSHNFGWPAEEGNGNNAAYTNPLFTYAHGEGNLAGCSITGGDFYEPGTGNYPSQYTGKYFFIDYCNDWINYIDPNNPGSAVNFASGLAGAQNYLKVAPDGNIYYFSISQNSLYKIIYSGSSAPAITDQPDDLTVSQGQNASFSVSASGENPLSYQWKKSGVNVPGGNAATLNFTNVQAADAGTYSVVVSNSHGTVTSDPASLAVTAFNANPVATINSPANGSTYRHGDQINFSGNGTDPEDGTLSASKFSWIIEFHHLQHIHPGPGIPAGVTGGTFNTAYGEPSADVFFRIKLIVEDAQGLTDTDYVDIFPVKSMLSLSSEPSGMSILLDGQPFTTPYSVEAVSGMTRTIQAVSPQPYNDTNYVFSHWLSGGAATQDVLITDNNSDYSAVYVSTGTAIFVAQNAAENLFDLRIFPDPNNGNFSISMNTPFANNEKVKLSIMEISGKEVYRKEFKIDSQEFRQQIEMLNDLGAGVYTLQVMLGDKTASKRLVLTK
jgi:glucose/arabinose dehydrogenase